MQSASDQSRGHFVRVTWIRVYRDEFWNDFSMRLLIIIHSSVKFLMSFCTLLINYSRQVLMPLASDYVAVLAVLGVVATLPRCQAARAHLRVHLWHRGPLPRKTEARSYPNGRAEPLDQEPPCPETILATQMPRCPHLLSASWLLLLRYSRTSLQS